MPLELLFAKLKSMGGAKLTISNDRVKTELVLKREYLRFVWVTRQRDTAMRNNQRRSAIGDAQTKKKRPGKPGRSQRTALMNQL